MDTDQEPSKGGRPTDYRPEFCEEVANLCIAGATDFEVAESLGVHVSTLYRWKAIHPEFRESLKVGKELADDRMEASLYHRGVGYSHPAVKIFMPAGAEKPVFAPYTEHVPPDVGAATLWLINRRGEQWRAKQSLEHTGKDGGPIATRDETPGLGAVKAALASMLLRTQIPDGTAE